MAAACLLGGCGGSTVSIEGGDAGPSTSGVPPAYPTATTSSTPVVPGKPPAVRDAGARDGAVVVADAGSDPGVVDCNGTPCASNGSYCCVEPPPGTIRCVPETTSSCGGLRRQCDESADCPTGEQCFIPPNAAIFVAYNTTCAAFVPGDPYSYQVCKSSAECVNGQPCVAQNCRGQIIRTCGPIPAQRCQ